MSEENIQNESNKVVAENLNNNGGNKIVAALILAGLLGGGGYYAYSKISMKDVAKNTAMAGLDMAKEAAKKRLTKLDENMKASNEKFNTATVDIDKSNQSLNRLVDVYDPNGMISLADQSISIVSADRQLSAAIMSGDFARAKLIIESGVTLSFTNHKICVQNGSGNYERDMPTNIEQLRAAVSGPGGGYVLPTACSKLFLFDSVKSMRKSMGTEEVYTMNNYGFNDEQIRLPESNPYKQAYLKEKEKDLDNIQKEQKKVDMFSFLMDKTNFYINANYLQLPYIYRDKELPFSVRNIALNKYIEVLSNRTKIQKVTNNEALRGLKKELVDSVHSVAQAGTYNASISADVKNELENSEKFESKLDEDLKLFITEYVKISGAYIKVVNSVNPKTNPSILKQHGIAYQTDLELSINAFKQNGLSIQKNKNNMLFYANPGFGNGFYLAEQTTEIIKMINTVLNSKLTDINRQYSDGSTLLHYIADFNPSQGFDEEMGQALGIINRYLLNKGARANLINSKGQSAEDIALYNDANTFGLSKYKPIIRSYTDINFEK